MGGISFKKTTLSIVFSVLCLTGGVYVVNASSSPVLSKLEDKEVVAGETVRIRALAVDEDNDSLSFFWEQIAGEEVKLRGVNTDTLSFTAPEVTREKTLQFQLTVSDGGHNVEQQVEVVVSEKMNALPVVDAGIDQRVMAGDTVILQGSATDTDSLALTFLWEQTTGPVVNFTKNLVATSFIAPQVMEETLLTFKLTADDGSQVANDTVQVVILPHTEPALEDDTLPSLNEPAASEQEEQSLLSESLLFIDAPATAYPGDKLTLRAPLVSPDATYFWRVINSPLEVTDLYTRETTLVVPLTYSAGQELGVELTIFSQGQVLKKQHTIVVVGNNSRMPSASPVATVSPLPLKKQPETPSATNKLPLLDDFLSPKAQPAKLVSSIPTSSTAAVYTASIVQHSGTPKIVITAILLLAGIMCLTIGVLLNRRKVASLPVKKASSSHIYLYEQRK